MERKLGSNINVSILSECLANVLFANKKYSGCYPSFGKRCQEHCNNAELKNIPLLVPVCVFVLLLLRNMLGNYKCMMDFMCSFPYKC